MDENKLKNYQWAPIFSGSATIYILYKIIFSDLDGEKFRVSILALCFIFLVSAILYFLLKKLEKDKDVYMLSVVGRVVGDVFKRYGYKMAKLNADNASATDMNKIMQTIVNLVEKLNVLGVKKYLEK